MVRYLPDGRRDPSFGRGGVVKLTKMQPITAVALQSDGRIVLTAPIGAQGGVARLLPDGHLDGNFGFGGIISPGVSSAWYPTSVAVAADKRIYVGGMTGYLSDPAEHWYGSIYRIDPGGRSGDWAGWLTPGDGAPEEPKTVVNDFVLGPGKGLIAAGSLAPRELGARTQAVLARMVPGPVAGGSHTGPDPSFGTGLVLSDFLPPSPEAANALARDGERLVIAGQSAGKLMLARYSSAGAVDTRFGRGGTLVTGGGRAGEATANALALHGNRIYAAGSSAYRCGGGACEGLLLTGHKLNGKLDRRFGGDGVVDPKLRPAGSAAGEVAYGLAVGRDGAILVGGLLTGADSSRFFLRRYRPDGRPDPSFGDRGRVATLPAAVKPAR